MREVINHSTHIHLLNTIKSILTQTLEKLCKKMCFIQCHECKGFGHMRIECPNYLMKEKFENSKNKGLVATWSDTENELLMSMWMNVVTLWPLLPQPIR